MTSRLQELLAAEGQQLPGQPGRLAAGFPNQLRPLPNECRIVRPRGEQFRVTDDRGEQVVEVVGDAAGELSHGFELLRVPQFFLALAQRFLRRAALAYLAQEVAPLLEKFMHRASERAVFRAVREQALDRSRVVVFQAVHDPLQRPADPAMQRNREQEKEHERENNQREQQPVAGAIHLPDHGRIVGDEQPRERRAIPAGEGARENNLAVGKVIHFAICRRRRGYEMDFIIRKERHLSDH